MKYINKLDFILNNNNDDKNSKNYMKNQYSLITGINIKSHLQLLESNYSIIKTKMIDFKNSIYNLQHEIDQIDIKLTAQNKYVKDTLNPKKNNVRKSLEREIDNQKNLKNNYEDELTSIKKELIYLQENINEYSKRVKYLEDLGGLYTN